MRMTCWRLTLLLGLMVWGDPAESPPWLPVGFAAETVLPYAPDASQPPEPATIRTIGERMNRLKEVLTELRGKGVGDPALADIEVFLKAGQWIVRHNEFYRKSYGQDTIKVLDDGLLRASQQARGETPWLQQRGQQVIRAYRSAVDKSVQPYIVSLPAEYGRDPKRRWRLDVVLHGRNRNLTEVSFIRQHQGKPLPKDQDWVQIDVYGRGNNAYRWAGETDVYEAIRHFLAVEQLLGRGHLIDLRRVVLRGFSMGGAGTWHLGLHRPDQWCVLGPGAGFTRTHGYAKKLPDKLPAYQEACLHIYDAVDYAANVFDVPVVAYSGMEDPQRQAAVNIQKRLKALGLSMVHLEAPGLKHQFPPQWQKKAQAEYARQVTRGRPEYPERVRFVTYTMKYPGCDWVEIMGLEQHYREAQVDAQRKPDLDGFTVKTSNVRALHLGLWPGAVREELTIDIDGQQLKASPYPAGPKSLHFYLEKRKGKWEVVWPERLAVSRMRTPQKVTNLQGPIDDAFMSPFLCVRGNPQEAWHKNTQAYADASLARFQAEWSKFLRGNLPIKTDEEVTPGDIANRHLILFGDPGSNRLIRQVLPGLPLEWTPEGITWQGKTYKAAEHLPVLIFPSPLANNRYVVLNSGHTFHAPEFQDTNALLFPRLGDRALLRLDPKREHPLDHQIVEAGLFDDFWR
jgi:predicted esterase